jgi:hypothetical protein
MFPQGLYFALAIWRRRNEGRKPGDFWLPKSMTEDRRAMWHYVIADIKVTNKPLYIDILARDDFVLRAKS